MQRLFPTHLIRKSESAAPLWTLSVLDRDMPPMKALVPGAWEMIPALHNYRGRAAYEQTVFAGGNVRFVFGGVSFWAKVYLDGELLAEHYGAYTAFDAIAKNIPYGEHVLRVEVDNRFSEESALHFPNDYYSYGGITRPVDIEHLGDVYVRQLHVTPVRTAEGWQARVEAIVANLTDAALSCDVRLEAAEQEALVPVEVAPCGETVIVQVIDCPDVQAWEVDAPALYDVSAVIETDGEPVDDLRDRFGFRTVEIAGKDILFNGKKLTIKGFNRHEEYGPFGCTIPVEAMAHDILLMKDMHCNAVRTCHYPTTRASWICAMRWASWSGRNPMPAASRKPVCATLTSCRKTSCAPAKWWPSTTIIRSSSSGGASMSARTRPTTARTATARPTVCWTSWMPPAP